jgi:predicted transcriptional regulator
MEITHPVSSAIHHKDRELWQISPEATVFAAIELMCDKNVGALLVMENGQLIGLVTERDYTRNVALKGKSSREIPVREIMCMNVPCVSPQHSVDKCLHLMTEKRIRHLPVIEDGRVVGIISIGDLVKWIISAQNVLIDQLDHYIMGSYPV